MWDEITYPPQIPTDVWEKISNFIPHFTGHVITYSAKVYCVCFNKSMLVKLAPSEGSVAHMIFTQFSKSIQDSAKV